MNKKYIPRKMIPRSRFRDLYKKWDEENPFQHGSGWGDEPWSQEEMPLTDEIVRDAADISDSAKNC